MLSSLLIQLFIKNREDVHNRRVREQYGKLVGWVGVTLNFVLFLAKLGTGVVLKSVSIMADSFNNLSDSASSVITLAGFQMSSKPADKEHPFGHGRIEYISAFIVSFLIMLLGYEFMKTSIEKIIRPETVLFNVPSVMILLLSIGVKLWLSAFNRSIGKKIGSQALSAAAADSRNDVIVTSVTILSIVFTHFTQIVIDGYAGVLVAAFILYSGFNIARETLSPLLGEPADPELAGNLKNGILSYPGIIGAHDLIVHNYGPSNIMATIHAEVPADTGIVAAHEIIDRAERELGEKFGLLLLIHLDPIPLDNEKLAQLKTAVAAHLAALPDNITAHDYRLIPAETGFKFVFDLQVPHKYTPEQTERVKSAIIARICEVDTGCICIINAESGFDAI
ncbi:MAG: cation diffusion facilitator family transporter [Clostridiales bacterium]|nr:cation diffusion facilitator family transporter [Clostridiales bacterium]